MCSVKLFLCCVLHLCKCKHLQICLLVHRSEACPHQMGSHPSQQHLKSCCQNAFLAFGGICSRTPCDPVQGLITRRWMNSWIFKSDYTHTGYDFVTKLLTLIVNSFASLGVLSITDTRDLCPRVCICVVKCNKIWFTSVNIFHHAPLYFAHCDDLLVARLIQTSPYLADLNTADPTHFHT